MTNTSEAPKAPVARPPTRTVLIVAAAIVALVGLGLFIVSRYESSQRAIALAVQELGEKGHALDAEGCVDEVLAWNRRCSAMKSLCDASVPRVMEACLAAQDRRAWCAGLGDTTSDTHFGYKECAARGLERSAKKMCALTYRVIDGFCKQQSSAEAPPATGSRTER